MNRLQFDIHWIHWSNQLWFNPLRKMQMKWALFDRIHTMNKLKGIKSYMQPVTLFWVKIHQYATLLHCTTCFLMTMNTHTAVYLVYFETTYTTLLPQILEKAPNVDEPTAWNSPQQMHCFFLLYKNLMQALATPMKYLGGRRCPNLDFEMQVFFFVVSQ